MIATLALEAMGLPEDELPATRRAWPNTIAPVLSGNPEPTAVHVQIPAVRVS